MGGRAWEQWEDQILILNQKRGAKYEDTMKRTGRSRAAVRTRITMLGIRQNKVVRWCTEWDRWLERLVAEGYKRKEIAVLMNTTDASVRQRLYRLGLKLTEREEV